MELRFFPILADAIQRYMEEPEVRSLAHLTGIKWPEDVTVVEFVRTLLTGLERGNNRAFAGVLSEALGVRAQGAAANSTYQKREYHERMVSLLDDFKTALETEGVPEQLSVSGSKPFEAKSEARAFLAQAETPIIVVDNYVGAGTLDCLLDAKHPIKLLTGARPECMPGDFVRAVAEFQAEGRTIEVRRKDGLHDRYIAFNDRLWIVGSSLKDAGKKTLNIVELNDAKNERLGEIEEMWDSGNPL
jgi:hypothetical protein